MITYAAALEKLAERLLRDVDLFADLDAKAGDGDLGITATKIAEGIRIALQTPTDDIKAHLQLVGREVSKSAPSTFGTLFATGFIRASAAYPIEGDALSKFITCLTASYEGISMRGKSNLGERTLLDALHPAIEALKASPNLAVALASAATAAEFGAQATATMAPKHGRAGWIGERAQGVRDAGATVISSGFAALIEVPQAE